MPLCSEGAQVSPTSATAGLVKLRLLLVSELIVLRSQAVVVAMALAH
jgi:hypothetical protein